MRLNFKTDRLRPLHVQLVFNLAGIAAQAATESTTTTAGFWNTSEIRIGRLVEVQVFIFKMEVFGYLFYWNLATHGYARMII